MCGICGVISDDKPAIEPAVRRMMAAMVHRGPDDEGYEFLDVGSREVGPFAGFGFRRLAILDLTSAGHQPMFNPNTGDCLIFNGEIYNFRRLRTELQCEGVLFRGHSDTEVLLHALARFGAAAVDRLEGMFAFAFYEARTRRILLARDPLGIKPLYVATSTNQLVFASEVRAVLASEMVGGDLDPAGIAGLLAYGAPQDPLTIHRHIRSFPAGETRWYDMDGGIRPTANRRFWRFPDPLAAPPAADATTATLKDLLEKSVTRHLVSDRPIGVFLSAGIDSFSIAALAKRLHGRVKTFTVGFDEPGLADEVAEAAAAANALGTDHRAIVLESGSIGSLWERWLTTSDRPSVDGFNTFVVSQAVAGAGKTVALSGLGGDEIFGGYPNFSSVRRYQRILSALRPVPRIVRQLGLRLATQGRRSTFREKAIELFDSGPQLQRIALRLRRILTDRQILRLGLAPDALGLDADFLPPGSLASTAAESRGDDFNLVSQVESVLYMGNTLLRDTDAVSMANSLEVRVPLLDQPIVDFVSALPGHAKRRNGGPTKLLLREACRDLIPESLANRPKTGFSLPIDRWMHGPLRESCEASIDAAADSGVLDRGEVRAIWRDFLESRHNVHWIRPMTLVALGAYLRHNLAGPRALSDV
jgi:asparagine synthase (glutamine-hydrolysing)